MAKRWYVVHTYSQFEKSVQRALLERIERTGMQGVFFSNSGAEANEGASG